MSHLNHTRESAFSRRYFFKQSGAVAAGYVWGSGISSVLGGGGAHAGNELRLPPTFQILERVNRSLVPEDGGWKDTVLVSPGETVRLLIRFDAYTGRFLHHCHNLEHEDAGMMQNFEVIPSPDADLRIQCEGETCTVSWSAEVDGQLEVSSDLSLKSWQLVSGTPVLNDDRYMVSLPKSDTKRFYRIVKFPVG